VGTVTVVTVEIRYLLHNPPHLPGGGQRLTIFSPLCTARLWLEGGGGVEDVRGAGEHGVEGAGGQEVRLEERHRRPPAPGPAEGGGAHHPPPPGARSLGGKRGVGLIPSTNAEIAQTWNTLRSR